MKHLKMMRKKMAGWMALLAMVLLVASPATAYAEELSATEEGTAYETVIDDAVLTELETEKNAAKEAEQEKKEPAFTFKENFVILVCCIFSVSVCIVFALWGDPKDRLKARYKRARKQQELREKKMRAQEERQRRFAEEDALYEKAYAEAVAEAKAKAKAKEEEKARKAAEKAAKKTNR